MKDPVAIQFNRKMQSFRITVLILMTFVTVSQAQGEIWNCHFKGKGIEKSKVEIDTKLEIRIESQKAEDRNKVKFLLSDSSNNTTVSEGYLQRMSYSERIYRRDDKPPSTYDWEGAIFIPISNYENHEMPGILKGHLFSVDLPVDFTLFRDASASKKATAVLNTPKAKVPLKGTCRSSTIW